MGRIELNDNLQDIIVKMVEGNPGAVMALMEVIKEAPRIDPQSFGGGLSPLLELDTYEIYGSSIYVLFNDKCGRDVRRFVLLLRSVQLGITPVSKVKELAADQMRSVDLTEEEWSDIDEKVCAELSEFARGVNCEKSDEG